MFYSLPDGEQCFQSGHSGNLFCLQHAALSYQCILLHLAINYGLGNVTVISVEPCFICWAQCSVSNGIMQMLWRTNSFSRVTLASNQRCICSFILSTWWPTRCLSVALQKDMNNCSTFLLLRPKLSVVLVCGCANSLCEKWDTLVQLRLTLVTEGDKISSDHLKHFKPHCNKKTHHCCLPNISRDG